MFEGIDLYSDTTTKPTEGMRKAISEAVVGDEQKGEDPSTLKLEHRVAELLGFESALFFPSATMANEIAIRLHCNPGEELIAASNCHLFVAEAGGPAVHAHVMCKPINTDNGIFTAEQVLKDFNGRDSNYTPRSKLISIENTTNMGGGIPWPKETLDSVLLAAKEVGAKTHMDGARLMNAAVATRRSPKDIASPFDTVTLCLSKGLGCPTGAVLVFSKQYFAKVRYMKQQMGGCMRQSGILAGAGLYALNHNIERLQEDHDNAKRLGQGLSQGIKGIEVENSEPASNMVYFRLKSMSATEFEKEARSRGLSFSRVGKNRFRAVTHMDVNRQDIDKAVNIVKSIFQDS